MTRVTAFPYTLHFKRPAETSRGALRVKTAVFVRAEAGGAAGWGECSPMPGLSIDDRQDYVELVASACAAISAGQPLASLDLAGLPSIAFGLETALLDLAGGGRQRLVDTSFSRGEVALPTHGLIWMDTPAGILEQVAHKVEQGCSVIKLKVGARPFDQEWALLAELRRCWPAGEVELRLDANGAWQPVEALDRLHRLAHFEVAFLEQPIPPGRWQEMARLCAASPIPIALDEELIGAGSAEARRRLLETIRPQHLILKPSLLGGLSACEAWIAEAGRLGIGWWINSLLESNVGLNAIAQWASGLDDGRVHGLGTGQLFANNIPSPLGLDRCGLRLVWSAPWDFRTLWPDS